MVRDEAALTILAGHGLGNRSHGSRPIHRLPIVVRAPRSRVDIHMLTVQTEALCFNRICYFTVQHSHSAYRCPVSNPNCTEGIVRLSRYFSGTSGSMTVRVQHVVPRHGISVVIIEVVAGIRVIVFRQLFIFLTVANFGPLPCSIVTTTRKFFTVLGSVIIFGNVLITRQWIGTVLVFTGLFLDALYGKSAHSPPPVRPPVKETVVHSFPQHYAGSPINVDESEDKKD
ncbi:unnamed protein product [Cyprideis torosa]|uniref:Uncharacterized protein n=1 Tax=Cyprideis torosa TaxID=163714 RepID=A0A7R8WA37_9CRUS|nr:unnamed protein product [Cyprideis torosa]CAG0885461.1 unnamed protein product [Cyprideis torosa]